MYGRVKACLRRLSQYDACLPPARCLCLCSLQATGSVARPPAFLSQPSPWPPSLQLKDVEKCIDSIFAACHTPMQGIYAQVHLGGGLRWHLGGLLWYCPLGSAVPMLRLPRSAPPTHPPTPGLRAARLLLAHVPGRRCQVRLGLRHCVHRPLIHLQAQLAGHALVRAKPNNLPLSPTPTPTPPMPPDPRLTSTLATL